MKHAALALAGGYLQNARPVLALRAFRRFVQRWPADERAAETRQMIQKLEESLAAILEPYGLSLNESDLALAEQHEEVQFYLAHGSTRKSNAWRRTCCVSTRTLPQHATTSSLCCFMEGELEQAAAEAAARAGFSA